MKLQFFTVMTVCILMGAGCSSKPATVDVVGNTLKCAQLYEMKKTKYWGREIGQSRSLYSERLNTCLALNVYSDVEAQEGKYFMSVIDMSDDKDLLNYSETVKGFYFQDDRRINCAITYNHLKYQKENGEQFLEYGCDKLKLMDESFAQIRRLGFKVFDGFEIK